MPEEKPSWNDQVVEQIIGNLLRAGVLAAAVLVAAGGIGYLIQHGAEQPEFERFDPSKFPEFQSVSGTWQAALELRGRGLIQLGLLVLIATPVARVIFCIFAFARERDWTYVLVTFVVLSVLLYSLVGGML